MIKFQFSTIKKSTASTIQTECLVSIHMGVSVRKHRKYKKVLSRCHKCVMVNICILVKTNTFSGHGLLRKYRKSEGKELSETRGKFIRLSIGETIFYTAHQWMSGPNHMLDAKRYVNQNDYHLINIPNKDTDLSSVMPFHLKWYGWRPMPLCYIPWFLSRWWLFWWTQIYFHGMKTFRNISISLMKEGYF